MRGHYRGEERYLDHPYARMIWTIAETTSTQMRKHTTGSAIRSYKRRYVRRTKKHGIKIKYTEVSLTLGEVDAVLSELKNTFKRIDFRVLLESNNVTITISNEDVHTEVEHRR